MSDFTDFSLILFSMLVITGAIFDFLTGRGIESIVNVIIAILIAIVFSYLSTKTKLFGE